MELTKEEISILIALINNANVLLKEAHIFLQIRDKLIHMTDK